MTWWQALLPVVTLALGWLGSELSDARRDVRSDARARAERQHAAADRAKERREVFERENLHALYAALSRLGRATTVHHLADIDAAKTSGRQYAGSVLPDNSIGEEVRLANVEAGRHALLVLGDDLRARVESARDAMNSLGWSPCTLDEADAMFQRHTTELMKAQQAIASRLRQLYEEEVST